MYRRAYAHTYAILLVERLTDLKRRRFMQRVYLGIEDWFAAGRMPIHSHSQKVDGAALITNIVII